MGERWEKVLQSRAAGARKRRISVTGRFRPVYGRRIALVVPQLTPVSISPRAPEGTGEHPAQEKAIARGCATCRRRFALETRFCPHDGTELGPLESVADLVPGEVLGERYRVERLLGEGGMGSVYQVAHVSLARPMAVKVLRAELAGIPDLAARFLREARAAASIEHPNVVRITDFGHLATGQPYFVMELLGGISLRQLLESGPLPADRARRIAQQVAAGLEAAHQAGVVHRDLKPDNIHVDPAADDFVKILDFGLAQVCGATRLTGRGVVYGTPQYMSPEQAAGESHDARSDVYALGVLLYEMLSGRVPFDAPNFAGVLRQHLRRPPVPLSRLVPGVDLGGLEPVVMRCLAKRPSSRFANMRDVIAALEVRPAVAPTDPLTESSRAPHPPRVVSRLGVALGACGIGLGLLGAWWTFDALNDDVRRDGAEPRALTTEPRGATATRVHGAQVTTDAPGAPARPSSAPPPVVTTGAVGAARSASEADDRQGATSTQTSARPLHAQASPKTRRSASDESLERSRSGPQDPPPPPAEVALRKPSGARSSGEIIDPWSGGAAVAPAAPNP